MLPEIIIAAIPGQSKSVVSLKKNKKKKENADLNSRMEFITLAMVERMRLTCCVLPQGKALNICV